MPGAPVPLRPAAPPPAPANVVRLHPAAAPDEICAGEAHFHWPPDIHAAETHGRDQPFDEPFWREHCDPPESIEEQCGLGCLAILGAGMALAGCGLALAWAVAVGL